MLSRCLIKKVFNLKCLALYASLEKIGLLRPALPQKGLRLSEPAAVP